MKSSSDKQRELAIVLGSLFVFSSLLTLVNSFSSHIDEPINTHVAVEQVQEGVLDLQSPIEAAAFIHDLVESRSVEKIVTLLQTLEPIKITQLLNLLAQKVDKGTTNLSLSDLYELFAGAALIHKNDEYIAGLTKILLGLKTFYQEPFLYSVGVHPEYRQSVESFVKSLQKFQVEIDRLMVAAEKRVVATKDATQLKRFLSNRLPFNPQTKKQLVWEVVAGSAANDVPVLKEYGFDLTTVHEGKTPLIQAVMNGDIALVRALLQAGVPANTIANDAVGSALQQALIKKNLPIELLLREYGARER